MHISKLQLVNYRNFARASVHFRAGVNTIIGENGSGKTNLFRALRLLLDENMVRGARRLEAGDFNRGLANWRGHWIVISLEFDQVSHEEAIQALFLHGTGNVEEGVVDRAAYTLIFRPKVAVRQRLADLEAGDFDGLTDVLAAVDISDYETIFTGKSSADFTDPATYRQLVGDFDAVEFPDPNDPPEIGGRISSVMSIYDEICFTFVQALRDVVAEFQNNRTNPLLTLLRSKSGDINAADFAAISGLVGNLNSSIQGLPDVVGVRNDIRQTIADAAGETYSPARLTIRSELPDEADRLFQSLRLFVGESSPAYEGAIHELSLGGANLIYLTLKLLEFRYQKGKHACANILVIEEPEAHIHTHIQKTLFDRLSYDDTQVIYSTHSTHISEVSNVERINILGRAGETCEVYQPSVGLDAAQIGGLQRYLDAVRSNLLFAKSVILVEGDAEEILTPILVKKVLGLSLDELGISLINIRSTGFENVAVLFHPDRVRKRCAIVTDLDAALGDVEPDPLDSKEEAAAKASLARAAALGAARQAKLTALAASNPYLTCHFAPRTFEVELIAAGNAQTAIDLLPEIYTADATLTLAAADLASGELQRYGPRILACAAYAGKGWFAIKFGRLISPDSHIPGYLLDAILAAQGTLTRPLLKVIADYRLKYLAATGADAATLAGVQTAAARYAAGEIELADFTAAVAAAFPQDILAGVLERL